LQRQAWRLQDLGFGGGLGFTVELFFLALKQLSSISSSKESHPALFIGTFRDITSDWSKHKHSMGTQRLLLDMVVLHRGIISDSAYPTYIVHEFLILLGNVFEGETGPHIDNVVQHLTAVPTYVPRHALYVETLDVITRARASS
jgi:hypothetical protein